MKKGIILLEKKITQKQGKIGISLDGKAEALTVEFSSYEL